MPSLVANTAVISRAGWGADETLRYADSPRQKENVRKSLDYLSRPKTESELGAIQIQDEVDAFLDRRLGEMNETVSLIRYEDGHELVWPIEKVKKVNRVIIHHTAESIKE